MQPVISQGDMEITHEIAPMLSLRIGEGRFSVFFKNWVSFRRRGESILVVCRDAFTMERTRKMFLTALQAVGEERFGRSVSILFEIGAAATVPMLKAAEPKVSAPVPAATSPSQPTTSGAAKSSREEIAAANPLIRKREMTLNDVIVGASNRVAVTASKSVSANLGRVSPFFVHGPTGSGKSVLLQALATEVRRHASRPKVVYISAESFVSQFCDAIHGQGFPAFRAKFRTPDLLVVDDVQFLGGKRGSMGEFQQTIDDLLRAGKQVALAADQSPSELTALGPELINRLSGGLVCPLETPDFEMRMSLLRRWGNEATPVIPEDVLRLLAERLTGDVRPLAGAIHRLRAASIALDAKITTEFAERTLADVFRSVHKFVRLIDIEKAICESFSVDSASLHSASKSREVSQPRMLAMFLARKLTRAPLSEIGEYFGRRSHSTVISAQTKVQGWLKKNSKIALGLEECGIEEAIRRVEGRLKAV
jgi:chromosomal replication initiator protein